MELRVADGSWLAVPVAAAHALRFDWLCVPAPGALLPSGARSELGTVQVLPYFTRRSGAPCAADVVGSAVQAVGKAAREKRAAPRGLTFHEKKEAVWRI